jgi:hypothetical protein
MIKVFHAVVRMVVVYVLFYALQIGIWSALYSPISAPVILFVIVASFGSAFFATGYVFSDADKWKREHSKTADEHAAPFENADQASYRMRRMYPSGRTNYPTM